jgi:glycosyltransferase involved in cell wall biosynthesis
MFHYPRQEASTHGYLWYWIKDMVHRLVIRSAVKRAKHIFVTSEFTKKDVHETLSVPNSKMTVTYQAPFGVENISILEKESVLQKYFIKKPYIMYVGAAYPHKNLNALLDAWKIFQRKYGREYELVFAGKENFFYQKLQQTLKEKNYTDVRYIGLVSDEDLMLLYKHAKLFVFPSLYEGFGIPPLEAMVQNLPVVSSNVSCMPEVLQDAALYFDPTNTEEMADVLYKGISDEPIRSKLQENGQKLLSKYSWKVLAGQTQKIYIEILK